MIKALALFSGGLDSMLAAKIILQQGIHVEGVNFSIGFAQTEPAMRAAQQLPIKLHVIDAIDEFKSTLFNPKYGYGANLNPCLDCKIFMVKKALTLLKELKFDFMISGEVVGQRAKSQLKRMLPLVAAESLAEDLLLRPLSAKLLPLTLPEREGWVNRDLLYGFSGRSRKPQLELVKQLQITKYAQPAGGCLLTDASFCERLQKLWEFRKIKNYTKEDLALLKIGRHLYPSADIRLIVARNEIENNLIENYLAFFDYFELLSHKGPLAIFEGTSTSANLELAAKLVAKYSAGKDAELVTLKFKPLLGSEEILKINTNLQLIK